MLQAVPDLAELGPVVSLVARQSRTNDGSQSVPDQLAAMRDYCARQDPPWIVGAEYEEPDVSGRKPLAKRRGLRRAVEDVESGRSAIILTAYFDRFCRSVATRAEVVQRVEAKSGTVMTLDVGKTSNATAADKLSGTLLAAIAEFYADQVGEKTAASKARNVERGVCPFPWTTPAYVKGDDGRLVKHPTNAPLVAEAVRMRAGIGREAPASYPEIRRFLHENGISLSLAGVEGLLRSRLLRGEIHFGKLVNLNAHEPIVDEDTWRKAQEGRATRGRLAKSERLLARLGILVCGTCGGRMSANTCRNSAKTVYPVYRCGQRLCPNKALISGRIVEDAIRDEALRLSAEYAGRASAGDELEAARVAAESAERKLSETILSLLGFEGESAARTVLEELRRNRDEAVAKHEYLLRVTTPDVVVRTVDDWDELLLDERRRLIRAVLAAVRVAPGRGPGRITFEPRELRP